MTGILLLKVVYVAGSMDMSLKRSLRYLGQAK